MIELRITLRNAGELALLHATLQKIDDARKAADEAYYQSVDDATVAGAVDILTREVPAPQLEAPGYAEAAKDPEFVAEQLALVGEAPAPSVEQVTLALKAYIDRVGVPLAIEAVKEFGVTRVSDIPEDKRAAFLAKVAPAKVAA